MPRPVKRRRTDAPTPHKLDQFLRHLARTGSASYAAAYVGISRNTLYRRRRSDPVFAAGWAAASADAFERLRDVAHRRALAAPERTAPRQKKRGGNIRDYDSSLLIRLLRLHWPRIYGRTSEQS